MPATMEQIGRILGSDEFDAADKWVVKWQFGQLGGFYSALFDAIKQADGSNLNRLALGFPEQVEGFRRWAYGDLGDRLRDAGLNI